MTAKKVSTPHPPLNEIDVNTHVSMSLKAFFALIGAIIGLFFGFYQLVVAPKLIKTDQSYEEVRTDVKKQNIFMYEQFNGINIHLTNLQNDVNNLKIMESNAMIKRNVIERGVEKNAKMLKNGAYLDSIQSIKSSPFNYVLPQQNKTLNYTDANIKITH